MRIKDIMTRTTISVRPDESAITAIKTMLEHHISGIPVIDDAGTLVGIITEGDYMRRFELSSERRKSWWQKLLGSPGKQAEEYARSHGHTVMDLMTSPVHTISADADIAVAVEAMEQHKIKRLPVVHDNVLVGVVARADVLRALFWLMADTQITTEPDDEIRLQLLESIQHESWTSKACVRPSVHAGVVELYGTIFDERERAGLRVLAKNIPGVRAVHDHMLLIEPMSGTLISNGDDSLVSGTSTSDNEQRQPAHQ